MSGRIRSLKKKLEWYPTLTLSLALLIIALFSLQPSDPELAFERYGLYIGAIINQPYRLLTNHFIHYGSEHLILNTLFLLFFGMRLEYLGGVKKSDLLAGVLVSMMTADLGVFISQIVFGPTLVAGFSGVVFGFLGMHLFVTDSWWGMVGLGAWYVGVMFLFTWGSNIAWGGHIGGFVGGLIAADLLS